MGIKELLGWICCGIAIMCGVIVFVRSARARNPMDLYDRRSVFKREFEHQSELSKDPVFVVVVWVGIFFGLLGMYLIIGMFG